MEEPLVYGHKVLHLNGCMHSRSGGAANEQGDVEVLALRQHGQVENTSDSPQNVHVLSTTYAEFCAGYYCRHIPSFDAMTSI